VEFEVKANKKILRFKINDNFKFKK